MSLLCAFCFNSCWCETNKHPITSFMRYIAHNIENTQWYLIWNVLLQASNLWQNHLFVFLTFRDCDIFCCGPEWSHRSHSWHKRTDFAALLDLKFGAFDEWQGEVHHWLTDCIHVAQAISWEQQRGYREVGLKLLVPCVLLEDSAVRQQVLWQHRLLQLRKKRYEATCWVLQPEAAIPSAPTPKVLKRVISRNCQAGTIEQHRVCASKAVSNVQLDHSRMSRLLRLHRHKFVGREAERDLPSTKD